jgi:hypothetical protein
MVCLFYFKLFKTSVEAHLRAAKTVKRGAFAMRIGVLSFTQQDNTVVLSP